MPTFSRFIGYCQRLGCFLLLLGFALKTEAASVPTTLPPSSTTLYLPMVFSSAGAGLTVAFSETPATATAEAFARFAFSAPAATRYECALDNGAFFACTSPYVVLPPTASGLALGAHTFSVRAYGNSTVPGAPSTFGWAVTSVFATAGQPVTQTNQMPTPAADDGWLGIFRINCDFEHAAYDDPIVYPNNPGMAHLHSFYGNKLVSAASTTESFFTTGGSTCQGDTLNRSSYWVPTLLAPKVLSDGTQGWQVVSPLVGDDGVAHEVFYYSVAVADRTSVQPFPVGLRMIAGTASTQPGNPQPTTVARWHCLSWNASDNGNPNFSSSIPVCQLPDQVRFDIFFPSCWDGVNLDSADHKSHMAYPISPSGGRDGTVCPTTHPVPLPRVSYHYSFPVLPGNAVNGTSADWRLASDNFTVGNGVAGGWSLHGDWFNGWHPEVMAALINGCLHTGLDCHDGNMANGWRLGGVSEGSGVIPEIINDGLGGHTGH